MGLLDFLRGLNTPSGVVERAGFSERLAKMLGRRMTDSVQWSGYLRADHVRGGKVIATIASPNYLVDAGLSELASLISTSGTGAKFSAIAVGTNSAATAATQTSLSGESHRVAFADAIASNTATFTATFSFTGSYAIYEAGIFNHTTTGGDMLSRRTFGAVNVVSGDNLIITWSITANR